ncbi:hypothetical protein GCM10022251_82600 [Phytohabitans flavus]
MWAADSESEQLPSHLPDWDSNTDLIIERDVQLDLDRLARETGITSDASLALTTSWTSSSSDMSSYVPPVVVSASGTITLRAVLKGERLGGVVTLRTTLTLARPSAVRAPGVAWFPGSVLAEHRYSVGLEPSDPPFPTHEIDFSRTRLNPDASWHLETTTDLTAPFLGSFLLLLNTRDQELISAVAKGRKDKRQQLLIEDLEHGVGALLIELALHHRDELCDSDRWPPGTVGDVLKRILDAASKRADLRIADGPHDLAEVRTLITGAARATGRGRQFE